MRMTSRSEYAIRSLAYLVRSYDQDRYVPSGEIARECHIPAKYLEQILGGLHTAGILSSKKGHLGGYRLRRPPNRISLGDALRSVEGALVDVPSWLDRDAKGHREFGGLRRILLDVREAVRSVVDRASLEVLAREDYTLEEEKAMAVLSSYRYI
jgi:Rrf2 family protein